MKIVIALALSCMVGLTACSTSRSATPGDATPRDASCACGKKAAECACDACKGNNAAHCECGKGAAAHKGHAHGGGHSCGSH
jgi:hypothetical protein